MRPLVCAKSLTVVRIRFINVMIKEMFLTEYILLVCLILVFKCHYLIIVVFLTFINIKSDILMSYSCSLLLPNILVSLTFDFYFEISSGNNPTLNNSLLNHFDIFDIWRFWSRIQSC